MRRTATTMLWIVLAWAAACGPDPERREPEPADPVVPQAQTTTAGGEEDPP